MLCTCVRNGAVSCTGLFVTLDTLPDEASDLLPVLLLDLIVVGEVHLGRLDVGPRGRAWVGIGLEQLDDGRENGRYQASSGRCDQVERDAVARHCSIGVLVSSRSEEESQGLERTMRVEHLSDEADARWGFIFAEDDVHVVEAAWSMVRGIGMCQPLVRKRQVKVGERYTPSHGEPSGPKMEACQW